MYNLLISILSLVVQNLGNKEFSRRLPCKSPGPLLLNGLALTMTALLCACFGGATSISSRGLFLAVLFGALFVITITSFQRALQCGPLGLTSLIVSMSMVLPALFGVLVWGEAITVKKVVGVCCMLGVLTLSAMGNPKSGQGASGRWLALTLVAALLNGTLGVLQKAYSIECAGELAATYNFYSFGSGAVICLLMVAYYALKRVSFREWTSHPGALLGTSACIGIGSAGGNIFIMRALDMLPAMVVYPLVQGTLTVTLWVFSVCLYKERLTRLGLLSIVLCLAGFALLA